MQFCRILRETGIAHAPCLIVQQRQSWTLEVIRKCVFVNHRNQRKCSGSGAQKCRCRICSWGHNYYTITKCVQLRL